MNIKAAVWFGAVVFLCVVNVAFMLTPNHTCTCDGSNHTFGAINLKVFGATKWSDPEKRPYLTDFVLRYDVLHVNEIRDSTLTSVTAWWAMVNATSPCGPYGLVIGPPTGRTTYKEQYAFFYKICKVTLVDDFIVDDAEHDYFIRESLCARFRNNGTDSDWDIVLCGFHAIANDTLTPWELGNFTSIMDAAIDEYPTVKDFVMLGDFNAAPTYATYEFIVALPYYNNKTYNGNNWHWLITNEDDTNVASTQKPYDRIIEGGENLPNAVLDYGVWRFDEFYGLTYEQARGRWGNNI